MNFGGLGFTFSAVDKGLKGAISATYTGFANIGKAVGGFGKAAGESLSGLSSLFKPLSAESLDGMQSRTEGFTGALKRGMKGALGAVGSVSKKLGQFVVSGVQGFTDLTGKVGTFTAALTSRVLTSGLQALGRGVSSTASQAVTAMQGLTAAPTNLTTGMEAAMQHHAEAARRIGVNYGYLGAGLRTFTRQAAGMADSLNISDEQAAMAVRGFREAGAELRAVGLSSANMVARFSAVTGASSDLLRNSLLQARREFGMNDEQLQTMMHSTVAMGRYTGDVTAALNGMSETMQHLRQAAAQSGVELTAERMRQFTLGTNRAAAALFVFSQNSDDARQGANQIASSLLGAERQIQGLLAGTQDDLPALASELGIATGDIQRSFQLMQSGPDGFMSGLTQMVSAARATGRPMGAAMNQLLQRLTGAMDEQGANRIMTFVQQSMAQGTEGVDRAMAQMGERQNLRAMAAAHATGRTMQEEFERMNEQFTMSFRSLSRGAVGPFMRDTQAAFTQFNTSLRAVVQDGGPLGQLVERLSLVHQMGAVALLPPDARPFAAVFGSVANSLAPAVSALGSMGFRLGMLLNPMSLIAVAVGFVAVQFGALFLKTKNAGKAFVLLQERITTFTSSAVAFIERLVPMIVRAIPGILGAIGRIVQIAVPAALRIGAALLQGLVQIGVTLIRWAARFDWTGFVALLWRGLLPTLRAVFNVGAVVFQVVQRSLRSVDLTRIDYAGLLNPLLDGLRDGLLIAVRALPNLAGMVIDTILRGIEQIAASGMVSSLMTVLEGLLSRAIDVVVNGVLPALSQMLLRMSTQLPRLLRSLIDIAMGILMELPGRLTRLVTQLGTSLSQSMPGIVQNLLNGVWNLLAALPGLAWRVLAQLPALVSRIGPMIQAIIVGVRNVILGVFEGVRRWLVERFPQAAGTINTVFSGIRTVVVGVFTAIQTAASVVWGAISAAVSAIVPVVRWVAMALWEGISVTFRAIYAVVAAVVQFFVDGWRAVSHGASVAWNWIRENFVTPIGNALSAIGGWFQEHFGGAFTWLRTALDEVVGWFQRQIDRVGGAIQAIRNFFGGSSTAPTPAQNQAAAAANAAVNSVAANAQQASHAVSQTAQRATQAVQTQASTAAQSVSSAFSGLNLRMPSVSGAMPGLGAAVPGAAQASAAFDQIPTRANRALTQAATHAQTSFTQIDTTAQSTANTTATAFEQARDRIVGAFTSIRGASTGEQGVFAAMRVEATALFTGVSADATTAMTAVVTAFRGNIQTLATEISNVFSTTIARAVADAFLVAFNEVLLFVQNSYIRRMSDLFTRLIQNVNEQFHRFLTGLLNATDAVMRYLSDQIAGMSALVARATQAAMTIQARMQQATQASAGPVIDSRTRDLGTRTASNDDLYNAIMHPHWYDQDYRGLFIEKMDHLIDAVRTSTRGPAGSAGGTRADRSRVDRTLDSTLGTRTGSPAEPLTDASGTPSVMSRRGGGR